MPQKSLSIVIILAVSASVHSWAQVICSPGSDVVQATRSPKPSHTENVSWKFSVSTRADENGTDIPATEISAIIDGSTFSIGRFTGYPKAVTNMKKAGMPVDSILACRTWFGGAGDELYIVKENDTAVAVYHRHVDESDDTKPIFRKIKKIKIKQRNPGGAEYRE